MIFFCFVRAHARERLVGDAQSHEERFRSSASPSARGVSIALRKRDVSPDVARGIPGAYASRTAFAISIARSMALPLTVS